jgi:hypothetical protein
VLRADLLASQQRQWDLMRELFFAYAARRPVRKIAVVANKPVEPDAARAAEIDSSDLVFRMNSLQLDEPDQPPCLGTVCHVVFLSRAARITPWVFRNYSDRAYIVMQTGFTVFRTLRDLPAHWPADLGALPLPNQAVTARIADRLDPGREPKTVLPTTGTVALFLAHEMYPDAKLVATGFSFLTNRAQEEWAHHSGGTTRVNVRHKLDLEGALLESWVADGSVRFFQ